MYITLKPDSNPLLIYFKNIPIGLLIMKMLFLAKITKTCVLLLDIVSVERQ